MSTVRIQRWQGDTWAIPCIVTQAANGAPVNLNGFTLGAEFSIAGSTLIQPLTVAGGQIVVSDATNGTFTVYIPPVYTSQAPADSMANPPTPVPTRCKLFYTDTLGNRTTLGVVYFTVWDGSEPDPEITEGQQVSIVYNSAQYTLEVAGTQGAAGPMSITSAAITDATPFSRSLLQQTTAAAARQLLAAIGGTYGLVEDANYTALATDLVVNIAALTQPRQITLPSPAAANPLTTLRVIDSTGALTAALYVDVLAPSGVSINGQPSVRMASAYEALRLENGNSCWVLG